jgi:hypothetical protein
MLPQGRTPPSRVKPVPIIIVIFILHQAHNKSSTQDHQAIADVITFAFYFLLRSGEYTGTTLDDTPFRLADVELHVVNRAINPIQCPDDDLHAATFVTFTFTTQKNGTKGEVITHGLSTDLLACPVKAIFRHILHLRQHKSTPTTPITLYLHNGKRIPIKATDVTTALRLATITTAHHTGLRHSDFSARSLRAGGAMALMCGRIDHNTIRMLGRWHSAMALMCGRIDHNTIRMLGRWHSDAMLRYLHLQAKPLMRQFAVTMFKNGTYSFLPTNTVPSGDY